MGDQHVAGPLPTHGTTQKQNKHTQTSMSREEFEPTIQVFELSKTVNALDSAAVVIGPLKFTCLHKILPVLMEETGYVETKDYQLVRDLMYNLCLCNLLSSAAYCYNNRKSRNLYNFRLNVIVFSYGC
jgi:hypothetical protein